MIQPLSDFKHSVGMFMGNAGDRALTRHNALAVLLAEAIASWANVEGFMLRMFVDMLGGNKTLAADIYLSLDGDGPKKVAIRAAAESKLDADCLEIFDVLMAIAATNGKLRHPLVHCTWGDSASLPDALLLVDPKATLIDIDSMNGDAIRDQFIRNTSVYRAADFQYIIDANDRLCSYWQLLSFIVNQHPANQEGRLFRKLTEAPEIRDRLVTRRAQREKAKRGAPPRQPPPGTHI